MFVIYDSNTGKLCKAGTIFQEWDNLATAKAAQNRIRDIYPDTYIVDTRTGKVVA